MAFNFDKWNTIGGHCRAGSAMQVFAYKTNDILTDIFADGYFNELRGKAKKDDLIFIHREDTDGQNSTDIILRIALAPIEGNIQTANAISDDWSDDGTKIFPLIDGRQVHSGSGGFYPDDIDASKIVHTNGNKKLISVDINNAYNKIFKTNVPAADTDAGNAGNSSDIPRGNHSHPKTQATESVIGQSERASQAEANTGTDDLRHITPLKLAGRTATETRTGIAETATQPETDAETDDSRIVTPLKLAGKKASQAEAEAAANNVKIMTPLRTLQNSYANLGLKRVITENDTTDPISDIKFNAGRLWNNARTKLLNLPTFIKRLDAPFAAGNNQGMLGNTITKTANTWFDLFGMDKDSDDSPDYFADTSPTGANIPAGYSNPTYCGSIETDGSNNIKLYLQIDKWFIWKSLVIDNSITLGISAQLLTMSVPLGFNCIAILFGNTTSGAPNAHLITSPYQNDVAVDSTNGIHNVDNVAGENRAMPNIQVLTDTLSRIRARAEFASNTFKIGIFSYKNLALQDV